MTDKGNTAHSWQPTGFYCNWLLPSPAFEEDRTIIVLSLVKENWKMMNLLPGINHLFLYYFVLPIFLQREPKRFYCMLWHNRGFYRALIFQQCSITILFSHIHTTKSFFSMDCRQIDIEQQLSSGTDSGNSAYFIYTENPQDTLSWNGQSFLSYDWYMVITQFLQLFYPLYKFQDGIYRTIKVN